MKKFFVFLLILISVIFAACAYVKLRFPLKYAENVKNYAARYNLDESLVFAVIKAESGFDKEKVSHKGAVGLMQIMPKTAEYVSKEFFSGRKFELTNPGDNIELGCFYLAYLAEKFDNRAEILAAYNAGEGNVKLWKCRVKRSLVEEDIPFPETKKYVRKVIRFSKVYSFIHKQQTHADSGEISLLLKNKAVYKSINRIKTRQTNNLMYQKRRACEVNPI